MQEIRDVRDLHVGPWALIGDFNLLVNPEDKNKATTNRQMMARFRALLNRLELKELYLNGRPYTWSNERRNPTMEKIEHIFVSNSWEDIYPSNLLTALGSVASDHCPLLVDPNGFSTGPAFQIRKLLAQGEGVS